MRKIVFGLAIALTAGAALAHSGVKNATVMARMDAMATIGAQTKIIGDMAKGATAFDADRAAQALSRIETLAARTPHLFKAQETDPKSEALPEIWAEFDRFVALSDDLQETAGTLAVETPADLGPALGQLGAACKACHSRYRQ